MIKQGCNNQFTLPFHKLEYERIQDTPNSTATYDRFKSQSNLFTRASLLILLSALILLAIYRNSGTQLQSTTLSKVTPFKSISHPSGPTSLWGTISKPYPTGAFWTNLVVDNGEGAVDVYPYAIKTVKSGVQVSYSAFRRLVSSIAITDIFTSDLELSATEGYSSRAVSSHDNVSVSMTYKLAGSAVTSTYTTHLVKCSPFVTVVYSDSTPVIRSPLMHITKVEPRAVAGSTGRQYVVSLGNFEKWLVHCSAPIDFVWNDDTLTATGPLSGVLRVAVLPLQDSESAFNTLMKYVGKYAIGATTSITYGPVPASTASITYSFKTVGNGQLLMLALPHQVPLLQFPAIYDATHQQLWSVYDPVYCIKGKLRPVAGDSWRLTYSLLSPGWTYDVNQVLSTDQLDLIATNLQADVDAIVPTAVDPYTFGKQLARMSTIALIADNLGIASIRSTALAHIQTAITPWLQGTNDDALLYDSTYGGIVSSHGVADKLADFGAGWYNDHHFHFGYFIHAGATLAKLDNPFYQANKNALDALVRDVCNLNDADGDYPVSRHKDMFDGHSWASGLFVQANGKGQESSSESVNAYYASYLYGLATANNDLTRFAQLLLTMEVQAVQTYWHMRDASIYDALFATSNRMVGNVGASDVTASTWFGHDLKYVHGINMMPLTPATSSLFDAQYVRVQYPLLATSLPKDTAPSAPRCEDNADCKALGLTGMCCPNEQGVVLGCCDNHGSNPLNDEFISYVYVNLAVVDKATAWDKIVAQGSFGNGNSKSNSLFWAATRAPPLVGFNASHATEATRKSSHAIPAECTANSPCNVLGITGDCCPTSTGLFLGCCPVIASHKVDNSTLPHF